MEVSAPSRWLRPVILALGRLRQEDCCDLEAGLSYIVPSLLGYRVRTVPPKYYVTRLHLKKKKASFYPSISELLRIAFL